MDLEEIERCLLLALAGPLPGARAQVRMAPRPHRANWRAGYVPEGVRVGAGLMLFYPLGGVAHLLLTVRAKHLASHRGQVSLPGGGVEEGEGVVAAALREAEEEVAVEPGGVRVLGCLSPLHIPVSGYALHPVVGVAALRFDLRPLEREVERILEVPVEHLLDPARRKEEERALEGETRTIPYFDLEGEKVWGATAMVLSELLWLLDPPG